jgi:hypothetical protein
VGTMLLPMESTLVTNSYGGVCSFPGAKATAQLKSTWSSNKLTALFASSIE